MSQSLSVVVPARDAEPWITELLESILAQDVDELEVIVVDNGSSDSTADLVTAFASADARVRLIRSAATTAAAARNEGVDAASGEYLAFADSDDIVPDGAYRSMLESLVASGSDMVIGDHLKFSATATWSPTARWGTFASPGSFVAPDDRPELLTGRACWNRIFRRSFWDQAGLRFPEIASVDDIEPMTRALLEAEHVDVVAAQVYLYRDRSDASSISQRADAVTTARYLQQELACARLVADRAAFREQHAAIVVDADGWAHLARFLAAKPSSDDITVVRPALRELLDVLPSGVIERAAPVRRALWGLVLTGNWDVAVEFVDGVDASDARTRLAAWSTAMTALGRRIDDRIDLAVLVAEGLVPALVNGADEVSAAWLAEAVPQLAELPIGAAEPGLRAAMADALARGAASEVATVAGLRRVLPLVVQAATPTEGGLEVSGRLPSEVALTLVLRSGADIVTAPVCRDGDSWAASIASEELTSGRWSVTVRAAGIAEEFPVVTARMPLPPVDDPFVLQPLADRKDGWRFLVDRRVPKRRGIGALLTRVGRKGR